MGIEDRVEIKRPRKGDENAYPVSLLRQNYDDVEIKRPRKGDENHKHPV